MPSFSKFFRRVLVVSPLKLTERALLLRDWQSAQPQLFILGLPRSGTTLVYQYLVHRLKVAYFTNGVGRLPRSPCVVTRWERRQHGEYSSDFQSHYGSSAGASAPHEAGDVWARYFGYDEYVRFDELEERTVVRLRRTIACVQRAFGDAPFVNKNVKHLLRIPALHQIFPAAAFLVVHRDLRDVGLSVLRARSANGGDPQRWWSVKPPNYEEIKDLTPGRQVAFQLSALERRMEQDLQSVPADRVLHVEYGSFCENPETLIESSRAVWGEVAFRNPAVAHFETTVNEPRTHEERELTALLAGPGLCSR